MPGSRRQRLPSVGEILAVCGSVLLVIAAGAAYHLASGSTERESGAWTIGGDFIEFYMAGRILNDQDGANLYDLAVQERVCREIVPDALSLPLPFMYPPFVATAFRPLAWLPYPAATFVFLLTIVLVYVAALAALIDRFGPPSWPERAAVVVAALSFAPFAVYSWLGAQVSVVGFAAIALALREEDRGRRFSSGLALSLCVYKPTLLVLVLPMLVVTGRFRQVGGFVLGAALLAVASVAAVGAEGVRDWFDKLTWMSAQATAGQSMFVSPHRYVDLTTFFRLLPYGRSSLGMSLLTVLVVAGSAVLAYAWWRSRRAGRSVRLLVWAATISSTLLINVYSPAYDAILVVVAGLLAFAALRDRQSSWLRLGTMMIVLYLAPWLSELATPHLRLQFHTVALVAFTVLLLLEARRAEQTGLTLGTT